MNQEDFFRMVDQAEGHRTLTFPALMRKVYIWMAMALAITGVTAFGVASSPNLLALIFSSKLLFFGLIIAELALVILLTARLQKLSLTTATLFFVLFAVINGVTLSSIFVIYTMASIAQTFLICSATFGVMAVYGYTTKRDLSSMGKLLFMALIGLIIATVVNIFMRSSGLDMAISYIGVLVFVGLTAWDTQKIKLMLANAEDMGESAQKIALIGALSLYLDFINLFIYLLRIFGRRD